MKYQLSVWERLTLLGCLPATGDLWNLLVVREMREGLSFTEAELADLQLREEGGSMRWEPNAVPAKKIEIGAAGLGIIRKALPEMIKRLHEVAQLTLGHLALCDRFGAEYGVEPEEATEGESTEDDE